MYSMSLVSMTYKKEKQQQKISSEAAGDLQNICYKITFLE